MSGGAIYGGGAIYSVTKRDIRDAITLANILGSNPVGRLWCGGWEDGPGLKAPCGHYGDWQCAAAAIGASADAAALVVAIANRIVDAWSHEDARLECALEILAPRHVTMLFNDNLEAELLLREGWLPPDYRITRRRHPDTGKHLELAWETTPEAYYVRGHVDREEFARVLRAYYGDRTPVGDKPVIEHAHATWALNGRDYMGNPNKILRECSPHARGAFAITALHTEDNLPPPKCLLCWNRHGSLSCICAATNNYAACKAAGAAA